MATLVTHYLYFPHKADASAVAATLRERGFRTAESRAGDDSAWLVRAIHDIIPSEQVLEDLRTMFDALVEPVGGEYDGWEALVGEE